MAMASTPLPRDGIIAGLRKRGGRRGKREFPSFLHFRPDRTGAGEEGDNLNSIADQHNQQLDDERREGGKKRRRGKKREKTRGHYHSDHLPL